MKALKILAEAKAALQRGVTRDTPEGERSMGHTVRIFEAVTGIALTETQGWVFMLCLKQARMMRGKPHPDNYVDLAGYAALAGESALEARFDNAPPSRSDLLHGGEPYARPTCGGTPDSNQPCVCGRCLMPGHHASDCEMGI